jgi:hypothetical protein
MLTISRDGKARRIASEWISPRDTGLTAFATSGMIDDRVQAEVQAEINHIRKVRSDLQRPATPEDAAALRDLTFLAEYLEAEGHRTPVQGWSNIWG